MKRVSGNPVHDFFLRIGPRQDDAACAWHFRAGEQEMSGRVVLFQVCAVGLQMLVDISARILHEGGPYMEIWSFKNNILTQFSSGLDT